MRAAFYAVMVKELRQTIRDRRMMALLLVAPLVQLFVFGSAANLEVEHIPTAVVDHDRTIDSREAIRRLLADGTLDEVRVDVHGGNASGDAAPDIDSATRALVQGRVAAVVVIEVGYSRHLTRSASGARGTPARVQVIVDGGDPNRSSVASSAVGRFFQAVGADVVTTRIFRSGPQSGVVGTGSGEVSLAPRVLYNPRLETAVYMVPGISAMLLLLITTIIMSMGLARERESGTLEQIQVTPVSPLVLLVAKMLPFAFIGLFDWILATVVGAYVFDVPIAGSLLLLGATLLYLMNTLSVGLLISTVSATQQQAFLGGFLFMMPASLLSGIMTPIRSMPDWLQVLTVVNPVRHYQEIIRAVLLRGVGPADIAAQLAALAIFGTVLSLFAATRFRKTVA